MVQRIGGPGPDKLVGTAGDDELDGRGGDDRLFGLGGDDFIAGNAGDDRLFGGGGGLDFLFGGGGDDILNGEGGTDELQGEIGDDRLNGGLGNDELYGGGGRDAVNGGEGSDRLQGNGIVGTNDFATDIVSGGAGRDFLFGDDGSSDVLRGDAGDDVIRVNDDVAFGGAGDDLLSTFRTVGRLSGGAGADTFDLTTITDDALDPSLPDRTVVTDFSAQDTVSFAARDFAGGEQLGGLALFDLLDTSGNGSLGREDAFRQVTPGGTELGVSRDAQSLAIRVGDDIVDFLDVASIARADWSAVGA